MCKKAPFSRLGHCPDSRVQNRTVGRCKKCTQNTYWFSLGLLYIWQPQPSHIHSHHSHHPSPNGFDRRISAIFFLMAEAAKELSPNWPMIWDWSSHKSTPRATRALAHPTLPSRPCSSAGLSPVSACGEPSKPDGPRWPSPPPGDSGLSPVSA